MPFDVSAATVALAAAAMVVGISKTSIGGFGAIASAVFALAMPTRESTAAVLLLLITGDLVAVSRFRRHANWALLRRLFPSVLPGVALGALFMAHVDDHTLRRTIGVLLVVSVALSLWNRRRTAAAAAGHTVTGHSVTGQPATPHTASGRPAPTEHSHPHLATSIAAGSAAGFTTMCANAAGPVMTLYLLAARIDKRAFVGTNAWFFLLVNLSKTPFSAALGLFPASTLRLTLALIPFVLVGTWVGTKIVGTLSQRQFDDLALTASAIAAVLLVVR